MGRLQVQLYIEPVWLYPKQACGFQSIENGRERVGVLGCVFSHWESTSGWGLVRRIWAWEWGKEGVRAATKLLWVRTELSGEWDWWEHCSGHWVLA